MTPAAYIPRPHEETDYLVDTPEPRALLQKTFLGHHPVEMIHSPYVSPASERVLRSFYGDEVWEGIAKRVGVHINEYAEAHFNLLQAGETPVVTQVTQDSPVPTVSIASKGSELTPTCCHSNPNIPLLKRISSTNPRCLSLFEKFPDTCVVLGDAERLESEVVKLVGAMEHDGINVNLICAKDAVHDILMMRWWDERVREEVWRNIDTWVRGVAVCK
jgi:acetyl esterase/lipase